MKRIKAGIIGVGFIGPAHIEALRRLGNVEVAALVDSDEALAQKKASSLYIEKSYGDYRQLLEDPSIETVHICTPNLYHFSMSYEALKAGKHVICEKPLAMTSEEGEKLTAFAEKQGLIGAVHFNLRFYPLVQQAHEMVLRGELGRIFSVNGSYQQDWLLKDTDYSWRLEPEQSGKSRAVADIGLHWLDTVEFVAGLRVDSLCADMGIFHPVRKQPAAPLESFAGHQQDMTYIERPVTTEDYAGVLLGFTGGARGSLHVSQTAAGRKNRMYFEIYGEKASIAFDSEVPNQLWLGYRDNPNSILHKDPSLMYGEGKNTVSLPGGHAEGFPDTSKQLFKRVYDCIASGSAERNFPSFADGVRGLKLCEAITASASKKCWMTVPLE